MPGLVWGMVRDGRLVHVRGFGSQEPNTARPVTADSLFRIASMSKAFTALAILKLRDEGRLRLDDLAEQLCAGAARLALSDRATARASASATCSPMSAASSPTIRGATASRC